MSCEYGLFTLNDLHDMMKNYLGSTDFPETQQDEETAQALGQEMHEDDNEGKHESTDYNVYSKVYLQKRLQKHFGQHLYFAQVCGRKNVTYFQNLVSHIVSNKWYEGIDGDEGTDAEKLVRTAARLIRAEIRGKQYDMESYPPISSAAADKECVPALLKLFMECIVTDKLNKNAIVQAIVQASRPRTAILPILFGLDVDLDAHGSANLICEVSRLGFCISYDEVVIFKQSTMVRNQSP
jgi:hypothetical protein